MKEILGYGLFQFCGSSKYSILNIKSRELASFLQINVSLKHSVEVRACVPISKGEEITDHYVTALNGTMYRRTHLRDGWFFECKCQRCKDPSEFRTNCSAFVCNKKGKHF